MTTVVEGAALGSGFVGAVAVPVVVDAVAASVVVTGGVVGAPALDELHAAVEPASTVSTAAIPAQRCGARVPNCARHAGVGSFAISPL
jgi:hypothetical protein